MSDQSVLAATPTAEHVLRPRFGAFLADSSGLCCWVSSDLCDITGLARHEIVGQFWFRIFIERDRKEAIARWEACMQSGVPFSFLGTLDHKGKKGPRFMAQSEPLPPLGEKAGSILGFILETPEAGKHPRYDRLSETIDKLQKAERERFDLSAALNAADTTINQLQSEVNRTLQKHHDLAKRFDELGKTVSKLETDLTKAHSEKSGLETHVSELRAAQARMAGEQQKELASARAGLEADLAAKAAELETAAKDKEGLRKQLAELEAKLAHTVSAQIKSSEDLRAQERETSERIRALESALEREKTAARTTLDEQNQEHAKGKAELEAQLLKMLGEASDLLNSKKQLSDRAANLERLLEKSAEREKELLTRVRTLEQQPIAQPPQSDAIAEREKQPEGSDLELAAERKKNQELLARLADLGEKLAKANEDVEDGRKAVRAISQQADKIDAIKARYEKQLVEARQQCEKLTSDLAAARQTAEVERDNLQTALGSRPQLPSRPYSWALNHVSKRIQLIFHELFGFLGSTQLSGDKAAALALLRTSADLLGKLVAGLVDIVALEHREAGIAHERLNLKRQLRQFAGLIEFKALQRGINFSYEISDPIPDTVYGDWQRLEHVLTALIGTLLTLLPSGSKLNFSVTLPQSSDDAAVCAYRVRCTEFSDPALAQQVCALAATTTALAQQSTDGLGFAVAARLLELMKGNLSFSEISGGVEGQFSITHACQESQAALPALAHTPTTPAPMAAEARLDHALSTQNQVPALPTQTQKRRVLLAEDNRINQNVISRILKRHNFEVAIAPNGKEAVTKAAASYYDIVLMDCQMPQMDGYQATRGIRSYQETRNQRSKIVGMSAHLDVDGKERCLSAGMDEYISKPIQEERLIQLLRGLLGD